MNNNQKPKKLEEIPKGNPFRVPENYFDELPERIMQNCETKEKQPKLIKILKPAFSLAALFIGVAIVAYLAVQVIDKPDKQSQFNQTDIARSHQDKPFSNEEEIIDALEGVQVEESSKETDEYIDYLLKEDIDYGTLINELESKNDTSKE